MASVLEISKTDHWVTQWVTESLLLEPFSMAPEVCVPVTVRHGGAHSDTQDVQNHNGSHGQVAEVG